MSEKPNNYTLVYEKRKEEFLCRNHEEIAKYTLSEISPDGRFLYLTYWGQEYAVELPAGEITLKNDSFSQVPVHDKIVMMSYLLDYKNYGVRSENYVPFRCIKEAAVFEKAYINMAIKPFVQAFDGKMDAFKKAAALMGGEECSYGDYAVKLKVFELIDLIYVYWEGDEEFACQVNILFDEKVADFIHAECVPTLGIDGVSKLILLY